MTTRGILDKREGTCIAIVGVGLIVGLVAGAGGIDLMDEGEREEEDVHRGNFIINIKVDDLINFINIQNDEYNEI